MLYSVRSLLELSDLSDDVRYLNKKNAVNIYRSLLFVCGVHA